MVIGLKLYYMQIESGNIAVRQLIILDENLFRNEVMIVINHFP